MSIIKIGSTDVVISHITHFEFLPGQGKPMVDETAQSLGYSVYEVPARLTVWIDGDKALHFTDQGTNVKEGYDKLKKVFGQ